MKKLLYCILILSVAGCKERYEAPVHLPVTGYLVVEGVINSVPGGATTITLSRTTKLDNRKIQYELGAVVKVEGDDNSFFTLPEVTAGHYTSNSLNLSTAHKYRLNITSGGKQYLSDFVSVRNNPPIDSVSWKPENSGLQLYISTHDPKDSTRYYQWEYTETWEFHSSFPSLLKYKIVNQGGKQVYSVVYRDSTSFAFDPRMYYCWKTVPSSAITLGSSAKLSKDIIYLPLLFIEPGSYKLSVLYSVEVKQYSWTKEGYAFLEEMKKNTEATGSVFDAQPSELNGNIHSVSDATEPVIGYVNICPVREQRIFIKSSDLPSWNYNAGCVQEEFDNISDSILAKASGLVPTFVAKLSPFPGGIKTFYASTNICVDCTLRGSPDKPSFWP